MVSQCNRAVHVKSTASLTHAITMDYALLVGMDTLVSVESIMKATTAPKVMNLLSF